MQSTPLITLSSIALDPVALTGGWLKVRANRGCCGIDGVDVDTFGRAIDGQVERLADELTCGRYQPAALRRCEIHPPGRKARVLGIPTVRDRVVQATVAQALSLAGELGFSNSSHGYRPGRSVGTAVAQVEQALGSGRQWVLDADILACFDNIPHRGLLATLAQWIDDGRVTELIEAWLKIGTVAPGTGIAQGSPLSPLLANLYLDQLDRVFGGAGIVHVRYADDFLAMTNTEEEARQAYVVAGSALTVLGLQIHPDKTHVVHAAQGFHFLGRNIVVPQSCMAKPTPAIPHTAVHELSSVLEASTNFVEVPAATSEAKDLEVPAEFSDHVSVAIDTASTLDSQEHPAFQTELKTLYLVEPGTHVRAEGERMIVMKEGKELGSFPIRQLDVILIIGNIGISAAAMRLAMAHQIPLVLLEANGRFSGIVDAHDSRFLAVHDAQYRLAADAAKSLQVARSIVVAKINNGLVVLQRHHQGDAGPTAAAEVDRALDALRQMRAQSRQVRTLEILRGCEGFAAKSFFAGLRALVGPEWRFAERVRRPPTDPINAMLSFGYSLLYHNVFALTKAVGLNPHRGNLHLPRPNHPALVSDLMEVFRSPIVDALVLSLVRQGRIRPHDFDTTPEGCLFKTNARKRFIHGFEARMTGAVQSEGASSSTPLITGEGGYRAKLGREVKAYVDFVRGTAPNFVPLLVR